jgi:hypothetical protein
MMGMLMWQRQMHSQLQLRLLGVARLQQARLLPQLQQLLLLQGRRVRLLLQLLLRAQKGPRRDRRDQTGGEQEVGA